MIPELLLGLLGFTGEVVCEGKDSFAVSLSFDMVTEAEREQINRIVPLGWFFKELSKYVEVNGARWGSENSFIYKTAFCLAIADILERYKTDVADMETKFTREGPFPLSHMIYQLQQYSLALPAAYHCCQVVESKRIRGCQFLDFLSNYRTGVPTVSDVITRLLLRVRVVFLKQCLSWVLHGELEDPEREFFIQMRADRHESSIENDYLEGAASAVGGKQPFDWTTTYALRLEMLPESHCSPRLAAKILLCGKAVRMLRETASELHRLDTLEGGQGRSGETSERLMVMGASVFDPVGAIYSYLSSGGGAISSEDEPSAESAEPLGSKPLAHLAPAVEDVSLGEEGESFIRSVISRHTQKSGYTLSELESFSRQFHNIISAAPTSFVGSFENLIESVNTTISGRLWLLLKERFGFVQFLVGLRNTYLIGKGEMFQVFLDNILTLMSRPPPTDSQADSLLTWDVVRSAAKLLNLDDDAMSETLKLRANSSTISLSDFSVEDVVKLQGVFSVGEPAGGSRHRHVFLGKPRAGVALVSGANATSMPSDKPPVVPASTAMWGGETLAQMGGSLLGAPQAPAPLAYTSAAATVADAKYMLKGFSATCLFACDWNAVTKELRPDHPLLPRAAGGATGSQSATVHPAITLGTVMCTLHDVQLSQPAPLTAVSAGAQVGSVPTLASPYGLAAAGGAAMRVVGVGVSIHARVVSVGTDRLDYFAKVFVWTAAPPAGPRVGGSEYTPAFGTTSPSHGAASVASTAGRRASASNAEGVVLACSGEIPFAFGASSLDKPEDRNSSVLQAAAALALEVEYYRDLSRMSDTDMASTSRGGPSVTATPSVAASTQRGGGGVVHGLRARLRARNSSFSVAPSNSWDVDSTIDLDKHLRLLGGQGNVSIVGSGLFLPPSTASSSTRGSPVKPVTVNEKGSSLFHFNVSAFSFQCKGSSLATYPVASSATAARFPPTFAWLDARMNQYRAWMTLKLNFKFPRVFGIVVDQEAVSAYSRVFSSLIKVRLVVHAFERLWLARSALDTDRLFCHLRHAMHFFNSNLLYHLQVDVIDTEFSVLMAEVGRAKDFQTVLRAHRNFVASIVRMSHIDNNVVQDAIERVLQICLRFLAVSALHQQNEEILHASNTTTGPVGEVFYLPQEEFDAIRKDFFVQVSYLLQLMKKIESRGFVFRVDFNGFFSHLTQGGGAGGGGSSSS